MRLGTTGPVARSFPAHFLHSRDLAKLAKRRIKRLLCSSFATRTIRLEDLRGNSFCPGRPRLSLPTCRATLRRVGRILRRGSGTKYLALTQYTTAFRGVLRSVRVRSHVYRRFRNAFQRKVRLGGLHVSRRVPSVRRRVSGRCRPFSVVTGLVLSCYQAKGVGGPANCRKSCLSAVSSYASLLSATVRSRGNASQVLISGTLLTLA